MLSFITPQHTLVLLRIMIGIIMMAHGFQRFYYGTVGNFGEFLNSKGFIIGTVLAWAITLFELAGGAVMAAGFFSRWLALSWMVVIISGIFLVHLQHGWYVVGPHTGGVEYSVLILVCLLVIAANKKK